MTTWMGTGRGPVKWRPRQPNGHNGSIGSVLIPMREQVRPSMFGRNGREGESLRTNVRDHDYRDVCVAP
jgi:hypothetical protein